MRNLYLSNANATVMQPRARVAVARTLALDPILYWVLVLLILSVTVFARTWDVSGTNFWTDEVITSFRVQGALDDTFASLYRVGNQAPFYYLLMRLFPNDSPFLLRFPAMLFGILSVALAMHIVWKLYQNRWMTLWFGAVLAVHPMHIILSRTARFYTLLFVLGLLITYCFILIQRGRQSRRIWALFMISSLMAYLTHYSALALPFTQGLWIVWQWRRQRRIFWRWAWVQAGAVLPFVGWLLLSMSNYEETAHEVSSQYASIKDVPLSFMNLMTGYDTSFRWMLVPGLMIALIGLSFGLMNITSDRKIKPEAVYWVLLGVIPVLVMFTINQITGANYRDRYFLIALPAALMVFWIGWERDVYPVRQIALGVVLLTNLYMAVDMFSSQTYERTDWEEAGEFIAEQFRPGDKLLFESEVFYSAFSMYFAGDETALDESHILVENMNTTEMERETERIWAVYRVRHEDFHRAGWAEGIDPLTPGLSPISDWLSDHRSNIVYRKAFKGGIIYLVDPGENLAQR